jgi:hypothetical protein
VFQVYLVDLVILVFLVILDFRDKKILDIKLVFDMRVGIPTQVNLVFLVDLEVLEIQGILIDLVLRDMRMVVWVSGMKLYLVILEPLVNLEYPVGLDFRGILHLVFDRLVVVFHMMVHLV